MTAAASALIARGRKGTVELVGFLTTELEDPVEVGPEALGGRRGGTGALKTERHHLRRARRHDQGVVGGGLGPDVLGVHAIALAPDHEVVYSVLDEGRQVVAAEEPGRVGLVLA